MPLTQLEEYDDCLDILDIVGADLDMASMDESFASRAYHPYARPPSSSRGAASSSSECGTASEYRIISQRKPWTQAEDAVVRQMVAVEGVRAWSEVARQLPGRTGKQCRERWHNHLDESVKKEPWTKEEERMLLELQRHLGNRWSDIAKYLTGRTDNAIKNHWNSVLRKGNNIGHLLLPGGRLPSSFPRGVIPPPPPAPLEAAALRPPVQRVLEVPTPLEADKINRLLKSNPESTLAQLVEFPVSAVCHEQRSDRAQRCLSALLATLRASDRAELLDATERLQEEIRANALSVAGDGEEDACAGLFG